MKKTDKIKKQLETMWIRMRYQRDAIAFAQDNRGMGTVEIILIIIVLIGLVLIFKTQITALVINLFGKITTNAEKI